MTEITVDILRETGVSILVTDGFVEAWLAIEHGSVSVKLSVDRGVTHELARHRLRLFTQESTRYCDYDGKGIRATSFLVSGFDRSDHAL